jgi:hypothetical protein
MYLFIIVFSALGLAHAQVRFSNVIPTGTGCTAGSFVTVFSPDSSTLSVLFSEFVVRVPQYDGINDNEAAGGSVLRRRQESNFQHKYCNLILDADVPEGQLVDAVEVSVFNRGATLLDAGVAATYTLAYVGHTGLSAPPARSRIIERKLWGSGRTPVPVSENWLSEPVLTIPVQSGCASVSQKTIRFELRSHITAQIPGGDLTKSGIVAVDSTDASASLRLRVITRPCGATPTPQRPDPRGGRRGSGLR